MPTNFGPPDSRSRVRGLIFPAIIAPLMRSSWAGLVLAERCQQIPVGGTLAALLSSARTGAVRSIV